MEPAHDAPQRPAEPPPGADQPAPPLQLSDDSPPAGPAVLSLQHAAKAFGAVQALADGTIDLRAGEAHALPAFRNSRLIPSCNSSRRAGPPSSKPPGHCC
jgi:hypothetical protein